MTAVDKDAQDGENKSSALHITLAIVETIHVEEAADGEHRQALIGFGDRAVSTIRDQV